MCLKSTVFSGNLSLMFLKEKEDLKNGSSRHLETSDEKMMVCTLRKEETFCSTVMMS